MAGEKAGLLDLSETTLSTAVTFADDRFRHWRGIGVGDAIPPFEDNFIATKKLAAEGKLLRKEMPVTEEADIEKIKAVLSSDKVLELCDECVLGAEFLTPTQKQIYYDKSAERLAEYGPKNVVADVQKQHLFVASRFEIVDGHHRWQSVMLTNPQEPLLLFRIGMELGPLLKFLLNLSDELGRERNQ